MDFDAYYLKVLKYLSIRPRSEKEIRDYLKRKIKPYVIANVVKQSSSNAEIATSQAPRNDEDLINLVIHKLKQQKFLNDEEFAKMWVRSRNMQKPKGKRVLDLELKQKGIAQDVINSVLANNAKEHSELDLAKDLLERKKKKYQNMAKEERFNKAGSMLARRGFGFDIIKKAIDLLEW